jgi:hypothetical protein
VVHLIVAGLVAGIEAGSSWVGLADREVVQVGRLAWAGADNAVDALVDRVGDERLRRVGYYLNPAEAAWVS